MQHVVTVVQTAERGGPVPFPDQVGVALVLEYGHAVFAAEAQHLVASFHAEHRAGRVLKGGDGVDVLGPDAGVTEVCEGGRQGVHAHAVLVQRHADHVHPQLAPAAHHPLVREEFGDDRVAGFEQHFVNELDTLIGARSDEDVLIARPHAAIVGQFLDEESAQPGVPLRAALHVVGRQVLAFLPQYTGGGFDEFFNGYLLGIIMAADEIVGREPTPGRRPRRRAFGKQAVIVKVCRGHFVFSPCGPGMKAFGVLSGQLQTRRYMPISWRHYLSINPLPRTDARPRRFRYTAPHEFPQPGRKVKRRWQEP